MDQFILSSPLGELRARLEMLASFERQMWQEIHASQFEKASFSTGDGGDEQLDDGEEEGESVSFSSIRLPLELRIVLAHMLSNVLQYYGQFVPAADEALSRLKTPIEKVHLPKTSYPSFIFF